MIHYQRYKLVAPHLVLLLCPNITVQYQEHRLYSRLASYSSNKSSAKLLPFSVLFRYMLSLYNFVGRVVQCQ